MLRNGRTQAIWNSAPNARAAPMSGESLVVRVREAAETLRELQRGGVTSQKSYSPQDLSNIARMMTGEGER